MSNLPISLEVESGLRMIARQHGLTRTLEERLIELAYGLTYKEIAEKNTITNNTVKTQVRGVLRKLHLDNSREIRHAARAAGRRSRRGANQQDVTQFLRLRFE